MEAPLLILSGAYVNAEIAAEYGRIPPSFLPLGGIRLFARQAALARGPVYLTLPDDFELDQVDMHLLSRLKVSVIRVSAEISLIEAIRCAVSALGDYTRLDLLHGDTLVEPGAMSETDSLACHADPGPYYWAYIDESAGVVRFEQGFGDGMKARRVVCGYQRVGDLKAFVRAANKADSYVDLLTRYHSSNKLEFHKVTDWYDFGHLGLLYRSKRKISIARAFNSISSDEYFAIKSSLDKMKMRAESYWYENLPAELEIFTPRYFGQYDKNDRAGYRIEYIYQPLVSDLFVFGNLPSNAKIRMLSSCFDFLKKCREFVPSQGALELSEQYLLDLSRSLYSEKTKSRISSFIKSSELKLVEPISVNGRSLPAVHEVAARLIALIPAPTANEISICHGDLFFGNMLFDYRASRIIVIDPRGGFIPGAPSMWGDQRYDLAKLAHSVIGAYDHILAGRSKLTVLDDNNWLFELPKTAHVTEVEDYFFDQIERYYDVSKPVLLAMTALLFLSMLPLHADNKVRQHHLLANGLRLASMSLII
tara:strand:- start:4187 stop:5791 length:1605 start_codon:yes stop_codon:yes gene_type:complete